MTTEPARLRHTAALAALMTATAWLLGLAARHSLSSVDGDPAAGVVAAAALAAALCAGWLGLAATLHCLAHVPGRVGSVMGRAATVVTPALVGRLLAVTVSTTSAAVAVPAAASATVAAAHAAEVPAPDFGASPSPGRSVDEVRSPSPGWTPSEPRPVRQPALEVLGSRTGAVTDEGYVVRRGDCLWDIVGRHLGPRATPTAIAEALPAWHEANRDVVGPDPDVIQPGITLIPPTQQH
jgi:hypothetical protein